MVCKKCGSQIENGTKFCHNCGAMVEDYDQVNNQYQNYTQSNYYNQQSYAYNGNRSSGFFDTLFGDAGKKIKTIANVYFIIISFCGLVIFIKSLDNSSFVGTAFGIFIGCVLSGYLVGLSLHITGQMASNLEELKKHFCDK